MNQVFAGGGEVGALMRSMDWSSTALGPPVEWPQSLRTAISILLNSRYPMFVFWGPKLVKIYNDSYRPITGSKHPWALGKPGPEVWPEIWDTIGPMVATVIGNGEATWSADLMLFMERNGFPEEVYFTFSYSPIRDESGGIGGMFCACTETTEKVLGERRLRTLRDLAAGSAEATTVAEVCRIACDVLETNSADVPFALLYLLAPETDDAKLVAAAGTAAGATISPSLVAAGDQSVWPLARVGETLRAEVVSGLSARLSNQPIGPWPEPPTQAMVLPLVAQGHDRAVGFLVVGIGSRRTFDDPYRDFLSLVTNQVATSLANVRAFEEERRRAEALAEIDRAKTAFFSNVSHEFRTPLTLMLGPIDDGLADALHPLPPEQRERQELVRRNGLRLQKLVNTLLDFARIEAGRAQATFVPTDLSTLTLDLASSFRSAVENAGLRLVVDCPALPGAVSVDPSMWEKIVLNLLSNAFKFTFKGEIRVSLRSLGDKVELAVADTGTGIPVEELPHVFQRFHRVEGARGRSHEGSGIGLALVRELTKLHEGEVRVTSALGEGSTFRVTIPAVRGATSTHGRASEMRTFTPTGIGPNSFLSEVAQWSGTADALTSTDASSARSEARILVADDNADMRTYVGRLLSPYWHVTTVEDGVQALASAQAAPPDLVISDVMMPGMDGLALVRALRADERTRTVPVVLLSARAGEDSTVAGLATGADAYLTKPFSANELLARVTAQLSLSSLRQEALRSERAHADENQRLLLEARAATRSREDMVAVVSHDLRAPLSAIRIAAELIERSRVQGEHAERVRSKATLIKRSVDGMDRLIADLLDISSIESGTLSVDVRLEDVEPIIGEARDVVAGPAREKGIELSIEVERGLPRILVDKDRVVQVLSNLLGNSLKFTPSGGRIHVDVRGAADGVAFAVSDTGPGISPEAMSHIFDRYWHSVQKGRQGHGLGLSIAKAIVEAHHGLLQAESKVGDGSTFTFTLPTSISRPRLEKNEPERPYQGGPTCTAAQNGKSSEWRNRFEAAMLATRQILYDWNADNNTLVWAGRSEDILGYAPDAMPNTLEAFMAELIHPDDRKSFEDEIARVAATRQPFHLVYRGRHKDGSYVTTEDNGRFFFDADGKPTRMVGFVVDVTEKKKIEEQRDKERRRAEQLAELDRAKTVFFSNVSHEFRTPLTLILGPVEDALASPEKSLAGSKLEIVRRSALRLHKMVGTLLDFARIEAGRAQATFVPTDLSAFTADLASAFRSAVESAGLTFRVTCPPLPESIYVDPEMWEKIVLNLLSNALKYTHRGGVEVVVAWEADQAVVTVRDTGVGIPEDELAHVFERFYRVRGTQGRSHEGTGIGLALVRDLVKLHSGSVSVASQLGEGTSFTIRVPRGSAHLPADSVDRTPRPRSTASGVASFVEETRRWSVTERDSVSEMDPTSRAVGGAAVPAEIASARILLVDDNADLRQYVRDVLGRVFHFVETASDGLEALDIVRKSPPDLVLSDIMMPRLDGFGLVRELRASELTQTIPVILLSARAGEESTVDGLASGADDYIVKPFSARELVARVRVQLEVSRARSQIWREHARADELEKSLAVRDTFLSVASHEFRTPLTALAVQLENLLRLVSRNQSTSPNADVTKKLETALRQTDRLTRLLDDLLDTSRFAFGGVELELEEFELAELVRAVEARLREEARPTNTHFRIDAVEARGRWDRSRLEEVLVSLFTNAIRYAPGSEVDIVLSCDDDSATVCVSDRGIGISPTDLPRIFDRFERASSSDHYGGFGIGLYLARQVVEAHGGAIQVESTPHEGTTFRVTLPRQPRLSVQQPRAQPFAAEAVGND